MNPHPLKLDRIIENPDATHKFVAIFNNGTKTKFGAKGYQDFTMHKNIQRRQRYIQRHWRDLSTNDPTRAGYLSMFILWNKPSLQKSLQDYRTRLSIYNKTNHFPTDIH